MLPSLRHAIPGLLLLAFSSCNKSDKPAVPAASSPSPTGQAAAPSDPKGAIDRQLTLLKAGDVEGLKACFTERHRAAITSQLVDQAKAEASQRTLEDLVASVEPGEFEGKKTAKIKMKNGRTLTTLVETDGKWLADTIWFR